MKLSEVLRETQVKGLSGPVDRVIHSLRYDSRLVEENDVFFAWSGEKTDGHNFIAEICDRGAAAVILENTKFALGGGSTFVEVENARHALATMSATFFGHPEQTLEMIGVTGTNGKTTTSFILKHLLSEPKVSVGLIGTVQYEIGERILPASRTTPESLDLFDLLARMRTAQCRVAVMEVSSHALAQGRVLPIHFQIGIFTNLTQDHLDYHQTMENYFEAKKLLFTNLDRSENPGIAILPQDDFYGEKIRATLSSRVRILTYSAQSSADVYATDLGYTSSGTEGLLHLGGEEHAFALPLLGSYNVANAMAAAAAAFASGVAPRKIAERLRTTPQVPGRLEKFISPDGVTVVVDYAHTDDAVRKALKVLRKITPGRLHVIIGCGGNRDAAKRPLMARAAVETADRVIFTADNPRYENPEKIFDEMEAGVSDAKNWERIPDRRQAIALALASARPGDVVCLAGKGHETTQEIAGQYHPFDDRLVAQEFLARRTDL